MILGTEKVTKLVMKMYLHWLLGLSSHPVTACLEIEISSSSDADIGVGLPITQPIASKHGTLTKVKIMRIKVPSAVRIFEISNRMEVRFLVLFSDSRYLSLHSPQCCWLTGSVGALVLGGRCPCWTSINRRPVSCFHFSTRICHQSQL